MAAFLLGVSVSPQDTLGEFRKLAAEIAARRQASAEEKEPLQTRALELLDATAVAAFNEASTAPQSRLPALNRVQEKLHALAGPEPRVGEDYQAVQLMTEGDGVAPVYGVAVNFGLSGPSAVRLYAPTEQVKAGAQQVWTGYRLAAKIDRFTHEDFFDEYLEVVPVNPSAAVFVTVTGRTDERKTGLFMAWRLEGRQLRNLWTSELLEHSAYEAKDGEFALEYCAEADESKPSVCKKLQRDRYVWSCGWTKQ